MAREKVPDKKPKWSCRLCDIIFRNKAGYERHLYKHTGQKPYICPTCCVNKAFVTEDNLRSHMKEVHSGNLYHCNSCVSSLKTESSLERHRREVHGEKSFYLCPVCMSKYCQARGAARHCDKQHSELHLRESDMIEVPENAVVAIGKLTPGSSGSGADRPQTSSIWFTEARFPAAALVTYAVPVDAYAEPQIWIQKTVENSSGEEIGMLLSQRPYQDSESFRDAVSALLAPPAEDNTMRLPECYFPVGEGEFSPTGTGFQHSMHVDVGQQWPQTSCDGLNATPSEVPQDVWVWEDVESPSGSALSQQPMSDEELSAFFDSLSGSLACLVDVGEQRTGMPLEWPMESSMHPSCGNMLEFDFLS